jgi:hypothetical protein
MLFWLFVAVFIISIIVLTINDKVCGDLYDAIGDIFTGSSILSIGIAIVMAFAICISNFGADAKAAKYKERYSSLVYQYENEIYCDDNVVYDLLTDIREYNEDIAYYQEIQDNTWLGIFYPDIYDQFKLIELDEEWYW